MPERDIHLLLDKLRTGFAQEAWAEFLDQYSDLIYKAAYHSTADQETASDCYLYICEQLSRAAFKRLLRFRPEGPAKFETWLGVVARNLCFDWLRRRYGRNRQFRSIGRLSEFDREVFRLHTQQGKRLDEVFAQLKSQHPDVTLEQIEAADARVQQALSGRHRWLLQQRSAGREISQLGVAGEEGSTSLEPEDGRPSPESALLVQEDQRRLRSALGMLEPEERLLIRLRFEEGLSLAEIARLTGADSPQHSHHRLSVILNKLRLQLTGREKLKDVSVREV